MWKYFDRYFSMVDSHRFSRMHARFDILRSMNAAWRILSPFLHNNISISSILYYSKRYSFSGNLSLEKSARYEEKLKHG